MMMQRLSEGIQHKLLMKLMEFDYTIEYKKGKENKVVDALSRRDHSALSISSITPDWITEVESSYHNDPQLTEILHQLAINNQAVPHYSLHSRILRYKGIVCIGKDDTLKTKILSSLHSLAIGGILTLELPCKE
jgi:hypothetical protein